MSESESKICPYCSERVNSAAKVCPRCRQWLSIYSLRNPGVGYLTGFLLFVFYVWIMGAFLHQMFRKGRDFSSYRDGISIVESRMNLPDTARNSEIYVVGLLTNRTDVGWKEIQLDMRFFNKTGQMVDADSESVSETVMPHTEMAFRTSIRPGRPLSDYDSYQISVRCAKDSQTLF